MSNINKLFKEELKVVNIGLESFYNDFNNARSHRESRSGQYYRW